LNPEELKDKILDWIAEKDFLILKVTKTQRTHFIFVIKSKQRSILNFPINVALSKKPEALLLSLISVIKGEDNKSFRGIDKKYMEKLVGELADRARSSDLDFSFSSSNNETRFRGIRTLFPHELTRDVFFMEIPVLNEYRNYLYNTFKKYKLSKPKGTNYGI